MASATNSSYSSMLKYLEESKITDLTVVLDTGDKFLLQGFIMAASSCAIRDIWESGFKYVHIANCSAVGFKIFLNYIQRGKVEVSDDTVVEAMDTALGLRAIPFRDRCMQEMIARIRGSTCVRYYKASKSPELRGLREKLFNFIQQNMKSVVENNEFRKLTKDELIDILINLRTEGGNTTQDITEACRKWCLHHPEALLKDIMTSVNEANSNIDRTATETTSAIKLTPDDIDNHIVYVVVPKYRTELEIFDTERLITSMAVKDIKYIPTIKTQPVSHGSVVFFLGGEYSNSLSSFDLDTSTWSQLEDAKYAGHDRAVCASDDYIYSVGGRLKVKGKVVHSTSTAERFSIKKGKWETLRDYPFTVRGASACAVYNSVIVSGGVTNELTHLISIVIYNEDDKSWNNIGKMSRSRYYHFTCAFQGKMYIFGGNGKKHEPFIEVFDLETRQSTKLMDKFPLEYTVTCTDYGTRLGEDRVIFNDSFESYQTNVLFEFNLRTHETGRHVPEDLNNVKPYFLCGVTIKKNKDSL